ncbi:hypothetical protein FQN50_007347 [Emmonsiellopsis sp. PD_5]|nr:hypothetical protein FQN50_007347 [Emmonsiellopsis sp. PD_5]
MAVGSLPPLAPVPPATVRSVLQNEEWNACLDAWIALIELRLRMSPKEFQLSAPKDDSARLFLVSFFQEASSLLSSTTNNDLYADTKVKNLRRLCFLLTRRNLLEIRPVPLELTDWEFLAAFCRVYISSAAIRALLTQLWTEESQVLSPSIEKGKLLVMKYLSSPNPTENVKADKHLLSLTLLSLTAPGVGHVLMTGSDYIDTLFDAYKNNKINASLKKTIVANAYVAFASLLKSDPPATSLLLDQLFSLKASAKVDSKAETRVPTLLSDIICSTNILMKMEALFAGTNQKRGENLIASLRVYQAECSAFHTRYQRVKRRKDKGKGRAEEESEDVQEMHIHKMALVTQVQDLFPDLGTGYISKLLDHYADDPETVISHLLDDSLAPHLRSLNRSEDLSHHPPLPDLSPAPNPSPPPTTTTSTSTTPLPPRKNIFDNDAFDRLAISPSQIHYGRSTTSTTADTLLSSKTSSHGVNKAAILSALAAFDSDDDERDDTYDIADVGGTVDSLLPGTDADADADAAASRRQQQQLETNDATLFKLYKSTPAAFARDATTRRSQPRAALRKETGMTDEAIEGWAVMLARDAKRMARMEHAFVLGAGLGGAASGQPELPATAYRRAAGEDEEGGERGGSGRGRGGRGWGRGRGGGGGGGGGRGRGGGNVAGPSGDRETAVARQRKDASKGSRANHNRRDQRAKKMARGGMGV